MSRSDLLSSTSDRTIIRASTLSAYPDCPRRAATKIIRQEIIDAGFQLRSLSSSAGAVVGSGTHAGAGYMLIQKMNTGELGNATEAEQCALQELEDRIRNEGVIWDATTANLNTAQKQTIRQVKAYRFYTAPHVEPLAVEQRIEAEFAPGFISSGQADLLAGDVIHDLKTGVQRRANAAQYGNYSLLHRTKRPEFPEGGVVNGIVEDYVKRVALKHEQPAPEQHKYDVVAAENLAWATLNRIREDILRFRENGDPMAFMPNAMSQMCSDKYCPAFNTPFCIHHKKD